MILKTRILEYSCSAIAFTITIQDALKHESSRYAKVTVKMGNTDVSISKSLVMTLKPNSGSPLDYLKLQDLTVDFSRPHMQGLLESGEEWRN